MHCMSLFLVASSTGSTPRWRNENYDAVCHWYRSRLGDFHDPRTVPDLARIGAKLRQAFVVLLLLFGLRHGWVLSRASTLKGLPPCPKSNTTRQLDSP